ncbi:lactosylceramide 4-alpha-galactosyltransferase [Hyperolius riggenbachi]|uniref:lactosylceramide 4-alpha-galactosyltransferase n=1 Tax=Hyperolius riggenbachi TaxID=752182 RepID=UPI0035A2BB49
MAQIGLLSPWSAKFRLISVVSFCTFSILILFMYLKTDYIPEDELILHLLPKEVVCPETIPTVSNISHAMVHRGGIYFVETSERTSPTFQAMCAIESAARAHPKAKINILMKGLTVRSLSKHSNFGMSILSCFPNVKFSPLDFKKLFDDTPLSSWYTRVENQREFVDYPTLSDACRMAILWKEGGIYLDTDFIILKNLENITNAMGMQSPYTLNGAFLTFQSKHKFVELCMRDFTAHYNYWIYGHQGPQLLTRVYKRWCSIHRLRDKKTCQGVNVLSKEAFYPVDWQDWKRYFEPADPKDMKRILKNSYGVHLWNKKSQGQPVQLGSFLEQLQAKYCPTTNNLMKMYLLAEGLKS